MEIPDNNDVKYMEAKRKVKELKGFYIHLVVYVLVNLFIIARNVQEGDSLYDVDNYWTGIFWGIGLLVHGIRVLVPNIFLGRDWEERKTRELMDKFK